MKALDGWQVERVWTESGAWGFQLLWKQSRFGRVGYVSKGPVLTNETPDAIDAALMEIRRTARRLRLRALIVQPPDLSRIDQNDLVRHGFAPDPVPSVVRSTAIADLSGGREAYLGRMSRQVRREMRVAGEKGVTIRRGGREDLPLFFDLMCGSCRRQETRPNPARVESLFALWDALPGRLHLGFAEVEREPISALLMIGQGNCMTFWKKGWNSKGTQLFANCLLNVTAFDWACELGYKEVDFLALSLETARTLLRGEELSEAQRRSRDVFNLRLGAGPRLLPAAQLYVVHPVFRAVHRMLSRHSGIKAAMLRKLGAAGA